MVMMKDTGGVWGASPFGSGGVGGECAHKNLCYLSPFGTRKDVLNVRQYR